MSTTLTYKTVFSKEAFDENYRLNLYNIGDVVFIIETSEMFVITENSAVKYTSCFNYNNKYVITARGIGQTSNTDMMI